MLYICRTEGCSFPALETITMINNGIAILDVSPMKAIFDTAPETVSP